MFSPITHLKKNKIHTPIWMINSIISIIVLGCVTLLLLNAPVRDYERLVFEVPEGASVSAVAKSLEEEGVVRSRFIVHLFDRLSSHSVKSGDYAFYGTESARDIFSRLLGADYGDAHVRVTFPEGSTVNQISDILAANENLSSFNKRLFDIEAKEMEGYLFPDTYFFQPSNTHGDIVNHMNTKFQEVIDSFDIDWETHPRTKEDIVIMASIIQKEANSNLREKQMISGILWKRIDEGMLLQVDAPFKYLIGKASSQLTRVDLGMDSTYNTYRYAGLTPGPISNPGRDALYAALYPTESPYYFYLHDTDGNVHYAETHDGHVANKRKYLR
jgi:UPF0755 protein